VPNSGGSLKKFQSDKKLVADGVYGPKTDAIISRYMHVRDDLKIPLNSFRTFRVTSYYVTDQHDFSGGDTVPIPDPNFNTIAKCSPLFFVHTALEGTGKLRDGRLINVAGSKPKIPSNADWDSVLKVSKAIFPGHIPYGGVYPTADGNSVARVMTFNVVPTAQQGVGYGIGKANVPYTPFRTVASDIGAYSTSDMTYRGKGGLVPIGTKALVIDLIGTILPDGSIHDGWVTSNDTGGAIFGKHFDLFTGTQNYARTTYYPQLGHVWFSGIESRIPKDYTWGLTTV
jgi:3D (Asp-Asp-Asp) domain-containing protein